MFARLLPLALLLALLLPTLDAHADDGAIEAVGGHLRPMHENPQVAMTSEFVHAWVWPESVRVECVFFLANHGPATRVLVGFPCTSSGADVSAFVPFKQFASWVDGAPAATHVVVDTTHGGDGETAAGWYMKEVAFAADQARCVRDVYVARPGDNILDRWFEYTLDTGATWRGPIGSADLVVTLAGVTAAQLDNVAPPPTSRDARELRWHFDRIDPGEEGAPANLHVFWHAAPLRRAAPRSPVSCTVDVKARFLGFSEGDYTYAVFCVGDSLVTPDWAETLPYEFLAAHEGAEVVLRFEAAVPGDLQDLSRRRVRAVTIGGETQAAWWRGAVRRLGESRARARYMALADSLTDRPRAPLVCR